jgi:hypothetical protein
VNAHDNKNVIYYPMISTAEITLSRRLLKNLLFASLSVIPAFAGMTDKYLNTAF